MRRKLINTHSLIYIFLIAIFTLISYVSDQGVIRQEDNLRKSDIKIDNLTTSIYTVDSISNQLLSLSDFVTENLIELNRNQNFWIKNLILLDKNKYHLFYSFLGNYFLMYTPFFLVFLLKLLAFLTPRLPLHMILKKYHHLNLYL